MASKKCETYVCMYVCVYIYIYICVCVCVYITDYTQTVYELPLLPNNPAAKYLTTNRSGAKC
jgi:hypothetical protein